MCSRSYLFPRTRNTPLLLRRSRSNQILSCKYRCFVGLRRRKLHNVFAFILLSRNAKHTAPFAPSTDQTGYLRFAPHKNPKPISSLFCSPGTISYNGRQPTTLRPPIRANPSTRGFAGGRNVVERNERMRVKRNPKSAFGLIILCRRKAKPLPG